jgi:hypothetical protein
MPPSKSKPAAIAAVAKVAPPFQAPDADIAEIPVGFKLKRDLATSVATAAAIDLSGRKKALMAVGAGNVGKTTLLRWMIETVLQRGGTSFLAAVDPANRTLGDYFEGVLEPPSHVPAEALTWLERRLLRPVMAASNDTSVMIDFGGGDTTLAQLIASTDLVTVLEEAGVAPVLLYVLGPRIDDLSVIAAFEEAGFRPAATALVLNEGVADPTKPREETFAAVMRHSVYRAAIARGAVPIWMPRLIPAAEIELRRIAYWQARDGVSPDGRTVAPLSPFDRSRLHHWLAAMGTAFEPIKTWLPE